MCKLGVEPHFSDPASFWYWGPNSKMEIVAAMYKHGFRRESVFWDRTNTLEYYSERGVKDRYRFWPYTILEICRVIDPYLGPSTARSQSLPTLLRVCIGLCFVSVGSFNKTIVDMVTVPHVDPATSHRIIDLFLIAMTCKDMTKTWIQFKGKKRMSARVQ